MEQKIEENSTIDSLREPLLVKKTSLPDDGNSSLIEEEDDVANNNETKLQHTGGVDAAIIENIGSARTYYVIGQWVWLYVVWSTLKYLLFDFYVSTGVAVVPIMAWSAAMIGHCFFLIKLSLLLPDGDSKESLRPAQLNEETLPIILSGLRVFCLDNGDNADKFLVIVGISFLLFELCRGSCGYSALSTFLRKHHILGDDSDSYYEHDLESIDQEVDDQRLEAQTNNENPASQMVEERQADNLDWTARRDWVAIGQWIWLLFAWVILRFLVCNPDPCIMIWFLAMFGHGMLLAVMSKSRETNKPSSLFRMNRETVPMMLSGFYLFSIDNTADQYLVVISTCLVFSLTARAVWRFVLNMMFTTFANMEKDYFERLKEEEAEEAAQLEAQMQRMAYLETAPRPDPAKRRRRQVMVMVGPVFICFGLIVIRCTADLALQRSFPLFQLLGDTKRDTIGKLQNWDWGEKDFRRARNDVNLIRKKYD